MLLALIKYLKVLHDESFRFEFVDINGQVDKSPWQKYFVRMTCAVIAFVIIKLLNTGFSTDFVSYFSSVLSILVGLFITALIFSFDKFYKSEDVGEKLYKIQLDEAREGGQEKDYTLSLKSIEDKNSRQKLLDKQSLNYTKQFSYITGYNIVVCIVVILLLSLNTLFKDGMSLTLSEYYWDLDDINRETFVNFFKVLFSIFQRFFVLYLIGMVMYKTLFLVSSMVTYNIVKLKDQ